MKEKWVPAAAAGCSMAVLVLDSRCAAQAASEGLQLCLNSVIPSLFPMMVLSCYLSAWFGSAGLTAVGILGGFPTGAHCIAQGVRQGRWSKEQGQSLLGVCNLCGPGFLFGLAGTSLGHGLAGLGLFLVQLECAWMVWTIWGLRLEGGSASARVSLPQAVLAGCRGMVSVCAWVILAGVWVSFLRRWVGPFLPNAVQIVLTGVLELTNGCLALQELDDPMVRWLLACGMVSFGGVSVALQVQSAVDGTGMGVGTYMTQKAVMGILAVGLGWLSWSYGWLGLGAPALAVILLKKAVEKTIPVVYNRPKESKERDTYAISERYGKIL